MRIRSIFGLVPAALLVLATAAAAGGELPAGLTWRQVDYGDVLADARGATLYVSDRDREIGKTNCTGDCTQRWRPVTAPPDFQPAGEWSAIQRDDGTRQLTNRNKALYTSVLDQVPGETNGDGADGGWRILVKPPSLPPGFKVEGVRQAKVLADGAGMTLYAPDGEAAKNACTGPCAERWLPVPAPATAVVKGEWAPIDRADGIRQWSWRGRPLYRFADEQKAGEAAGASEAGWRPVVLRPAPPVPSGFTVQETMHGPVFADGRGLTVYGYFSAPEKMQSACDERCQQDDWKPVLAADGAKASGQWTLLSRADGSQQWAYKGHALFTSVRDRKPGDVRAIRYGYGGGNRDGNWQPIQPTS